VREPGIGERRLRLHGLHEASEQVVLAVAARMLAAGLVRGDSAFTPGRAIWRRSAAAELAQTLDRVLATGPANHQTRLLDELQRASDACIQLAAELQYLMHLSAADIKPETKRERISALLGLLDAEVRLPEDLAQACEVGVFKVGMGFKMQGWRQLEALYGFVRAWTEQPDAVRDDASSSPWSFKRFVEHIGGARAMRNLLKYLAFPDTFEPIVSQKHKDDIRLAFASYLDRPGDDVDRDLLAIRNRLEEQTGVRISFYSDDLMPRWRGGSVAASGRAGDDNPTPLAQKAWLVRGSSVRGADLIPQWLAEKICSLPASRLPKAAPGMSRAEIVRLVELGYATDSYNERNTKVEEFYSFLTRMSPGDVVTTTREEQMLLGRITGTARLASSSGGLADLVRPVDWATTGAPVDMPDLPPLLRARLRVQQDVVELTRDLPQLAPLLDLAGNADEDEAEEAEDRAAAPQVVLPRVTPAFARELHLPEDWLQEVVDVLRERRQLVLYGPPGTGKTHLAMKLAQHLTRDPQNVKVVQFHPTYSYEDFFEGYRPAQAADGSVGFQLKPGPFRRLVDRARDDETRPYVLIIDELNRANLASVFGELYFLLEYRNEAIDLVYSSDEQGFTMPENVFIVGTMNTLDRSVSLLDSAMRRRFAFIPLHPAEPPIRFLLDRWLEHHRFPSRSARLLDALNERIEEHDLAIGPSYFMRAEVYSGDDEGLRRVWRTSILPLLEEYYVDKMTPTDIAQHYEIDALLAAVSNDHGDAP
jgi:5-methylcytosine-specific restriction enzyme B